ncbi:MAG: hypothetical protein DI601_06415 [Azospirillum brasilense]|nr:MAG: hypothetical protein DI601_06415 [Azospirillum brasilense]PZR08554.1 MAG: hypothetical protein DI532_21610 [Azospirillum brasilense]
MSSIKPAELRIIDRVMGMEGGYVLDFSDRTFAQFFDKEMGVDIDNKAWHGNGTSKAKRLRAYLQLADDAKVAKVLRALDDYRLTASIQSANPDGELVQRFLGIVERLSGSGEGDALESIDTGAIHAFERDESLSEVIAAIQRDMQADRPQAVMDRLHTYCMKRFAHLIRANDPDADLPDSLPGRAGKYLNSLKASAKEGNPFSFAILKQAGFVFDQFNLIRNKNSLAHDNGLLSKAEAKFVFQAICNILSFIKSIEGHRFDG